MSIKLCPGHMAYRMTICCRSVSVPINLSLSCCIAELSLPPGVVVGWVILEAICFAVSTEVDMPSTCSCNTQAVVLMSVSKYKDLQPYPVYFCQVHLHNRVPHAGYASLCMVH